MSDQFVPGQIAIGAGGTTTDSCTLTGVTLGSAIAVFLWSGSNAAPATSSVSDVVQGAYSVGVNTAADGVNTVWVKPFYLLNATAGSHVITGTLPAGTSVFIAAGEIKAPTSGACTGDNALFNNAPGVAADAISSGVVTVTGAATLIAMCTDSASAATASEPSAGTGFTSRSNNANGTIGAYRIETIGVAANAAGTFTVASGTGADRFIAAAIAFLNPAPPQNAPLLPLMQMG